jgi:hypothetical protein
MSRSAPAARPDRVRWPDARSLDNSRAWRLLVWAGLVHSPSFEALGKCTRCRRQYRKRRQP